MDSSYQLSDEIRGYNLPPMQQRFRCFDSSINLCGSLADSQTANTMSDMERMDETGSPRKRIAVAVSSQEVQGVRPTSFNYNVALSRKLANRHAGLSPMLSSSALPYGQTMMTTVGHGDAGDQHQIPPYGYVQKHYDQVHGWAQGYGGGPGVDYGPAQPTGPLNEQLYMMGSYRSGHPMVARSNVVYVDPDASSYGYGSEGVPAASLDTRSNGLPDTSHAFPNGMTCYGTSATGRCIPMSADRSRSASSHAEGLADRRTSPLTPAVESVNMVEMNPSYHGYGSSPGHGSSMDRGSAMYTTSPPDELLVHGGPLRGSIPDYTYRYADTTPERGGGGQTNGGSIMTVEDAHYFPPGRGCYVGGNGLGSTGNGVGDGRGTSLAGLHG
ncbi:hypothetical protein E4U42_006718 [Claviceps africana]|uniref:Uncharacterized protein n=1 Tax=Claviceps africana TaxID=83212 RepID=A0A8K0J208_9HYPO|nr:hypothetical protein E4U42_006718 [Claviceps africana]